MSKGRAGARLLVLVALVAAFAAPAGAAAADDLVGDCAYTYEQPFTPWLDFASYTLVPNGDLESDAAGWSLDGGASVVADNESFYVHDAGDAHALSLPAGSSATTSGMCVAATSPDLRFFARNLGSPLSTLKVEVLFTDPLGRPHALPVALLLGGSSWQPTLPIPLLANLTLGTTSVAFRFTPLGGSEWRIDDVYVDPFKGE